MGGSSTKGRTSTWRKGTLLEARRHSEEKGGGARGKVGRGIVAICGDKQDKSGGRRTL